MRPASTRPTLAQRYGEIPPDDNIKKIKDFSASLKNQPANTGGYLLALKRVAKIRRRWPSAATAAAVLQISRDFRSGALGLPEPEEPSEREKQANLPTPIEPSELQLIAWKFGRSVKKEGSRLKPEFSDEIYNNARRGAQRSCTSNPVAADSAGDGKLLNRLSEMVVELGFEIPFAAGEVGDKSIKAIILADLPFNKGLHKTTTSWWATLSPPAP